MSPHRQAEDPAALLEVIRILCATAMDDARLGHSVRAMLRPAVSARRSPADGLVPLKVRLPDGRATNISLPRALLREAADKLGSERQARARARQLAAAAPPAVANRSGWVTSQLTLALSAPEGRVEPAHATPSRGA